MNLTDPIADMLTRIRNAIMAEKKSVVIPYSKLKVEIAKLFKKEGYISDIKLNNNNFPPTFIIDLKYKDGKSVIEGLQRISKPGRRVYTNVDEIPKVLGGLGVAIISTSKGVLTGKDCKKENVGGEVLLHIW